MHKKFKEPDLPPARPIISGCGSITENISLFVDHHTKNLVPLIPSFLQDTPHLLRELETLKTTGLPQGAFPVSIDVVGLYTNIPHNEGIESVRRALNTRKNPEVPTETLIEFLKHVLKYNIFEFNTNLYQQEIGTAMGTRVAPTMANIFMSEIDSKIQNCARDENLDFIYFYKRYIDDILVIWTGTLEQLNSLMTKINLLHPSIKFTCEFDSANRSTTYLDTTISLRDDVINTDLYRKPTDRVQYLLPSSCHPNHIFTNVPFSLALRIVRICSTREVLDRRLAELSEMLLSRSYNKNVIKNAISKARDLDRSVTLEKVIRVPNKRIVLALTYSPKLPSVPKILKKHWRTLTKDQKMLKIFPQPPMVAYKQPPNLKSVLCRAKLPQNTHSKRRLVGMQPCNKPCNVCPYIKKTKTFTSNHSKQSFPLKGLFTCATTGVIYLVSCLKCNKQYVGQTGRKFYLRAMEHLNSIYHKTNTIGIHFSSPLHNHNDFIVLIIEKVLPNSVNLRLEREEYWIKTLGTKQPLGLNKQD